MHRYFASNLLIAQNRPPGRSDMKRRKGKSLHFSLSLSLFIREIDGRNCFARGLGTPCILLRRSLGAIRARSRSVKNSRRGAARKNEYSSPHRPRFFMPRHTVGDRAARTDVGIIPRFVENQSDVFININIGRARPPARPPRGSRFMDFPAAPGSCPD